MLLQEPAKLMMPAPIALQIAFADTVPADTMTLAACGTPLHKALLTADADTETLPAPLAGLLKLHPVLPDTFVLLYPASQIAPPVAILSCNTR